MSVTGICHQAKVASVRKYSITLFQRSEQLLISALVARRSPARSQSSSRSLGDVFADVLYSSGRFFATFLSVLHGNFRTLLKAFA